MQWIKDKARDRISGIHHFIKSNARTYVAGLIANNGYGLLTTLKPEEAYKQAVKLLTDDAFLRAGPGAVLFSHPALWHYAYRLLFMFLRSAVHPDGFSGDTLGGFLKMKEFMKGAVMPLMVIVTVGCEVSSSYSLGDQAL